MVDASNRDGASAAERRFSPPPNGIQSLPAKGNAAASPRFSFRTPVVANRRFPGTGKRKRCTMLRAPA